MGSLTFPVAPGNHHAMNAYSTFLFVNPSLSAGVASVLDLSGTGPRYNSTKSDAAADARALRADMLATLHDADQALKQLADDLR